MTLNPLSSGVLLAVLALSLGGQVLAQNGGGGTANSSRGVGPMALQKAEQAKEQSTETTAVSGLSAADRRFMLDAAASGLFEVEAARLASSKASDPALQRYASMLVEDHTAANEELRGLASAKGIALPSRPKIGQQRALDRMAKLAGDDFDREFVRSVALREHQRDVRQFEAASRNARDPELKAWAAKVLPTLQRHLSQARQLPMMPMAGPGGVGQQGMGPGMGMGGSANGSAGANTAPRY